jgi:hypothetical protein
MFRPSFFFWMVLVMCFFVFGGFGMHSFVPALRGDFPPAPPIVHLHGVVFVSWMLLLLIQSALVCGGNVKLHRTLGTWGIAQGTATILIGLMMQLVASASGHAAGRPAGTDGLYLGLLAFLGFAVMFTLAIANRTRPDIHRRMILFAMLPVIPPGVNRFWANALGLDDPIPTFWLYLTLWSMAAAILLHERRTTGRISGYSMIGAGWIFVEGALHEAVVGSAAFEQLASAILGLVHYR